MTAGKQIGVTTEPRAIVHRAVERIGVTRTGSSRAAVTLLPGLAATVVVALAARLASRVLPALFGEVVLAVVLGVFTANLLALPARTGPGIRFSVQRLLRLGIVLLGARLSLVDVAEIGLSALGVVALCMLGAFSCAVLVGRALSLPPRLAVLIGVGTAVCGNSAIIATAPVIAAEEREVGYAVATITLFGTLAMFVYPLLGHALALPDAVFGFWTGVAVNDTSQVVAASAAYSARARDVATVVKLVRNTLMAPLILVIAWWASRRDAIIAGGTIRKSMVKALPIFVLGFLAMALGRTVGLIDPATALLCDQAARLCILVALAGVGLSTSLAEIRSIGTRACYLGFGIAALLAVLSLVLILALGVGSAP